MDVWKIAVNDLRIERISPGYFWPQKCQDSPNLTDAIRKDVFQTDSKRRRKPFESPLLRWSVIVAKTRHILRRDAMYDEGVDLFYLSFNLILIHRAFSIVLSFSISFSLFLYIFRPLFISCLLSPTTSCLNLFLSIFLLLSLSLYISIFFLLSLSLSHSLICFSGPFQSLPSRHLIRHRKRWSSSRWLRALFLIPSPSIPSLLQLFPPLFLFSNMPYEKIYRVPCSSLPCLFAEHLSRT